MCLIIIAEKEKPNLELLEKAATANPDGGGIAWRESGKVAYKKNLTAVEIFEISQEKPLPQVAHFRLATVGGKNPLLCHPFPVSKKVELALTGTAPRVLFHNGHMSGWKNDCRKVVLNQGEKFPPGPWSDSRAMAWLCACLGSSYMELLSEKICIFSAQKIQIFGEFVQRGGLQLSNTNFECSYSSYQFLYPNTTYIPKPYKR